MTCARMNAHIEKCSTWSHHPHHHHHQHRAVDMDVWVNKSGRYAYNVNQYQLITLYEYFMISKLAGGSWLSLEGRSPQAFTLMK